MLLQHSAGLLDLQNASQPSIRGRNDAVVNI